MIFKLTKGNLTETKTDYAFNDLQFEKLIIGYEGIYELNFNFFNEAFLYLGRQVSNNNSFATFYALDVFGRGVIIELKKDENKQGIGTQCLTSINYTSTRTGEDFVNFCLGRKASEEEAYTIKTFINCDYNQINIDSRVVLLARSFEPALFNFGSWITENSFAFKAIRYYSTVHNGETLVDFSTAFETFSKYSYSLKNIKNFKNQTQDSRKPTVFFHDIGHADEKWWNFLQKTNVITASYDNVESAACRGYNVLNQYMPGDVVVAYAKDVGVVGYGTVTSKGYAYKNHDINEFANSHYHTQSVQWQAVLPFFQAIPMKRVLELGLKGPVQTKHEIRYNKGIIDALLNEIQASFNKKKAA
jgi:hypothetical protein